MRRILFSLAIVIAAAANTVAAAAVEPHPWSGKKVVYLGDSITDPSQLTRHNHSTYWKYMQELYGIEPHVYAVSGYQWDRIYPMAQKMQSELGDTPDAILILLGTNDFNSGVPLGEWYQTAEEDVNRRGVTIRQPTRPSSRIQRAVTALRYFAASTSRKPTTSAPLVQTLPSFGRYFAPAPQPAILPPRERKASTNSFFPSNDE